MKTSFLPKSKPIILRVSVLTLTRADILKMIGWFLGEMMFHKTNLIFTNLLSDVNKTKTYIDISDRQKFELLV